MKRKLSAWHVLIGASWIVCPGVIIVATALCSMPQAAAIRHTQIDVLQAREQLALARNTVNEENRRQITHRLTEAQTTLHTFSCPAPAESTLIFHIGQLAKELQLKQFVSRFPDYPPEQTVEHSERIAEGWLVMEFVSDYVQLAAFVNGLERHKPALFVESIELRHNEENDRHAAVQMMLSYFIRKTAVPVTADGAQTPQRNAISTKEQNPCKS